MKLFNIAASAAAVLALGAAAPLVWGQATEPGLNGTTSIAPAAASPTVPGEKAAPGAPGSDASVSGGSAANEPAGSAGTDDQSEMMNSGYVHRKIDQAQAQGRDVSAAKMQAQMGDAAAQKGMTDEAAQHYQTALRSIGAMPPGTGDNSGQSTSSPHAARGAVD